MEVQQFLKVQIKGKSRLKTDVYNDIWFDFVGWSSVFWFDSKGGTSSINYWFILMLEMPSKKKENR